MDRTRPCGGRNVGSIPTGSTSIYGSQLLAPVAQRIERRPPKLKTEVRLLVGALKRKPPFGGGFLFLLLPYAGDRFSESGLLAVCSVSFEDSALGCLVDSLECLRKKL